MRIKSFDFSAHATREYSDTELEACKQSQRQQSDTVIMGKRKFQDYIPEGCHRLYSCVHCRAHLANHDELISKV